MRPISDITNDCLKMMKPHELFTWEKLWEKIFRNGEAPARKTKAYYTWLQERSREKNRINDELIRRKAPQRLIPVGHGQGVYLVNEEDVAEITIDKRARKMMGTFKRGRREMKNFIECDAISAEDKKMLIGMSGLIELQQDTMTVAIAKMPCLPEPTKKRLYKSIGIDVKTPARKNKNVKFTEKKKECMAQRKEQLEKLGPPRPDQIIETQIKAAEYARVSKRTIRRWAKTEEMPLTKEGYYIKPVLKIYKETSVVAA